MKITIKKFWADWSSTKKVVIISGVLILLSLIIQPFIPTGKIIPDDLTTPDQPRLIENTLISQIPIQEITIDVDRPDISSFLPIFESTSQISLVTIAQEIAARYSLESIDGVSGMWSNSTGSQFLSYSQMGEIISFIHQVDSEPHELSIVRSIEVAQLFVDTFISPQETIVNGSQEQLVSFTPDLNSVVLDEYETDFHYDYDEISSKNSVVTIPFIQTIGIYPIFLNSQPQQPVWISVGPEYTVVKADIAHSSPQLNRIGSGEVINFEKIKELIINKQGIVLDVTDDRPSRPIYKSIAEANLNSVTIEYRLDTTNNIALPYFRFEGFASFTDGSTGRVAIIHQAIHSTNTINLIE
jgi:hypothetical protein